jgi:putative membrane-bound dehydrogenase-like protein
MKITPFDRLFLCRCRESFMKRGFLCLSLIMTIAAGALAIFSLQEGQTPSTGPQTEKRFPPLKVATGFKATLFACDPLIEYPSVISIGPRPGSIFVAVDYMTGLVRDGKVKSEIRLVEDTDGDGYADKATTIARGFNSIQGLAYHDDTLYVMHAPYLTALRYDKKTGVADQRKDLLTGLGLKPEDNPSRLHCANGVVVGHDGWLYLAIGDNGVNVPRPEGDRLVYHGGGILRCRPDGHDLHLFSTGLRNIYDIALDAELNVFTRDNENDGGTYMIRVCHCFHGSDHGYPYDYEERPDHAMKPIGDFGLGSSAGGVCYLEKQFPPEYRGNLFFCEWGKAVVRYELKSASSGFAPVKELEFAAGDPKDIYPFKPTDIVVQRDGTMMVADYADGQQPKRGRGRIYHIAYVGQDSNPAAKVKASPKYKDDDIHQWLARLNAESYFERCEAQLAVQCSERFHRDIVMRGIADARMGARGRMHGIWLLARSRGPDPAVIDTLLRMAGTDPEPSVRAQAVRAVADLADPVLIKHRLDAGRGDGKLAERLAGLAKGQDPRVALEIVVALGRLRWADAPNWLRENLGKPDAALAHAAMQALRRSQNWPAILKLLDQPDNTPIRNVAMRAVADRYEIKVVDDLIERLKNEKDASGRREYADALARVYKKPGPWKYWGYRPAPRPANTQGWERTDAIAKSLDAVLADPNRDVRLAVLKRMQREKVPVDLVALGAWLRDEYQPGRAAAILALLSEQSAAGVRPLLEKVVPDKQHSAANRLAALALLVKGLDKAAGAPLLELAQELEDGPVLADALRRMAVYPNPQAGLLLANKLKSLDGAVRAAAIEALGQLQAKEGRDMVLQLLQDKDVRVRRAAAGAAGKLGAKVASEPLLKLMADADAAVRLASLDSLRLLGDPRVVPLAVAALNERALELKALECLGELGGPAQETAVVNLARHAPTSDIPAAVVRVLTAWSARKDATAKQRHSLNRAVAEVHGASGILARWNASGPITDKDAPKILLQLARDGKSPADWRTLFAAGAEARLVLAPKGSAKDARWFAQTEVAVNTATDVEFFASSRGGLQVWLNGESIFLRDQPRNFQFDSDRFAGRLDAGANRLLVQTGPSSTGVEFVEFHVRFRRKSAKTEHEKLTQAALNRPGNAERGRKVFFDKEKSLCLKCHQLGDQGECIGPKLTGVGGRFSRIYLVESILEPSRTIAPSFGTITVTLKSGKLLNGVKVGHSETTLTLADNQGQKHVLAKADIEEQQVSAVSSMPEGLELRLTQEEFVDLIAFLANQKESRKP